MSCNRVIVGFLGERRFGPVRLFLRSVRRGLRFGALAVEHRQARRGDVTEGGGPLERHIEVTLEDAVQDLVGQLVQVVGLRRLDDSRDHAVDLGVGGAGAERASH